MSFHELSQNQSRVQIDIRQTYEVYRQARRTMHQYAGGMFWKSVSGREYLIKVINRTGGNKSLGVRRPETERMFADFVAGKERAKERFASLEKSLSEFAGMSVGVSINRVPAVVTATLRKLDDFGLLGKNLMVIGTHAMYGYEAMTGVQFDAGLMATTDIDFLWDARSRLKLAVFDGEVVEAGLLAILRKVDRSFAPVGERGFRAANKSGFLVDLVKQAPNPPWKAGEPARLADSDLTPSWLQNIHWLLSSEKFNSIVLGQDGYPAPMVSPDPRAFAIYKMWLSAQADRDANKKKRDRLQALATAKLVQTHLPHLPFDAASSRMFPQAVLSAHLPSGFGEEI
jgi:hypothetical protein